MIEHADMATGGGAAMIHILGICPTPGFEGGGGSKFQRRKHNRI
jgi:hypothetical protein